MELKMPSFNKKSSAKPEAANKTSGEKQSGKKDGKLSLSLPKKGKAPVQQKVTMNFARRSVGIDIKKLAPVLAVIVVGALVFFKFGFLDKFSEKTAAYNELAAKQEELELINLKLKDYDELYEKYGRYSYGWMSDAEVNAIDRMEITRLIEEKIMPYASISNFSISNNVLTLNLYGVTLKQTSDIVKVVEADKLVKSASVYNASAENADEATVFMSIVLTAQKEEADK